MKHTIPAARALRLPFLYTVALTFASAAGAQTGNDWLEFSRDDSLLVGSIGVNDTEEKDYAWGDLDQDGWIDLVNVRKQPFTSNGRRANVLFMNEGGTLVDRTADYAINSDVAGDEGFHTLTNDRDVILVDVDNDGWLDVVTATTLSATLPKHISHPRIYMNLGNDGMGNWQGLRHEDARFPQLLLAGGSASWPRFCGVHAGDVTGDGYTDLYFSDYDQGGSGGGDFNDRLLINDGTGHFVDESFARMTSQMLNSDFGTSTVVVDLNLDGVLDIVKDSGLINPRIAVSYNDDQNEGFFDLYQQPYNGAPYHVAAGDLNNDGRPDLVISDDGSDTYLYNLSTDVFGRVVWGPARVFSFASAAGDDGFGSNNLIIDLDNDGWNDVIIADVDVDISGCNRRAHIYHNPGGAVGSQITLIEEAEFSGGGGWKGVVGITAGDLRGMHDVAVFDIDNDGDQDMVFGLCTGTHVWLSALDDLGQNYCDALANSTGAVASISAAGSGSAAANDLTLSATNLPQNQFGYFLTSQTQGLIMNPGGSAGNLCLGGSIGRFNTQVQNSGSAGAFSIPVNLTFIPVNPPVAVQPGETWNYQAWYRDIVLGASTSNFTDGFSITFE